MPGRPPRWPWSGTRRPSGYGRASAEEIGDELARAGVTVVSGLAIGIDAVAHTAALAAGGRTVAVLPSPIDRIYPPAHRDLARRMVAAGGALLTELSPGRQIGRPDFARRNRIIAGLAEAVVVVEAPDRSGALIDRRRGRRLRARAVRGSRSHGRSDLSRHEPPHRRPPGHPGDLASGPAPSHRSAAGPSAGQRAHPVRGRRACPRGASAAVRIGRGTGRSNPPVDLGAGRDPDHARGPRAGQRLRRSHLPPDPGGPSQRLARTPDPGQPLPPAFASSQMPGYTPGRPQTPGSSTRRVRRSPGAPVY